MAFMRTFNTKPKLEPRERRNGLGWYVLVTWGDRPSQEVGGFPSQTEAQKWIDHSAAAWVRERIDEEYGTPHDRM
jgi:hypothetical protein